MSQQLEVLIEEGKKNKDEVVEAFKTECNDIRNGVDNLGQTLTEDNAKNTEVLGAKIDELKERTLTKEDLELIVHSALKSAVKDEKNSEDVQKNHEPVDLNAKFTNQLEVDESTMVSTLDDSLVTTDLDQDITKKSQPSSRMPSFMAKLPFSKRRGGRD